MTVEPSRAGAHQAVETESETAELPGKRRGMSGSVSRSRPPGKPRELRTKADHASAASSAHFPLLSCPEGLGESYYHSGTSLYGKRLFATCKHTPETEFETFLFSLGKAGDPLINIPGLRK